MREKKRVVVGEAARRNKTKMCEVKREKTREVEAKGEVYKERGNEIKGTHQTRMLSYDYRSSWDFLKMA